MYSAIAENKRKTWLIMFAFVLLIGALGYFVSVAFFGEPYITVAVVIGAIIYSIIMYFSAGKLALAMHGAKEIDRRSEPRLYRTVENLAITTGMPMPKVYVIEDAGLNAFATGRDPDHAIVAATRGLLNALEDTELEGVMAHELGHVRNYDIRVSMIAMGLATVVSLIADISIRSMFFGGGNRSRNNGGNAMVIIGIIGVILAPIIARLIQSAISRQREYLADATGVETTRYPEGLAKALLKLNGNSKLKQQNTATAHLFIANPLSTKSVMKLFSTHPPIEERVSRLRNMGNRL